MTTSGTSARRMAATVLRAPWTPEPWLGTAQVMVGFPVALLASTVVITLASAALALAVTAVLAIPVLAVLFAACRLFTSWHRARIEGMRLKAFRNRRSLRLGAGAATAQFLRGVRSRSFMVRLS